MFLYFLLLFLLYIFYQVRHYFYFYLFCVMSFFLFCFYFFTLTFVFDCNVFVYICRGNFGMSRKRAIDSIVDLKDSISRSSASRKLSRYILTQGVAANIIKVTTKKVQATTADCTIINLPSISDGILLLILCLPSSERRTPGFVAW